MTTTATSLSRSTKGKGKVIEGNNSNPLGGEIIKSKEIIESNEATSSQPDEEAIAKARAALEKAKLSYEHAKTAYQLLTGKAPKVSGPGVISSILDIVTKSPKGVSKQEILDQLVNLFPDRTADGMLKTIQVQLCTRMNAEKHVNIIKTEEGKYLIK